MRDGGVRESGASLGGARVTSEEWEQIVKLLLTMVPQQRGYSVHEELASYEAAWIDTDANDPLEAPPQK